MIGKPGNNGRFAHSFDAGLKAILQPIHLHIHKLSPDQ
jgi:hypothetical protein